MQTLAGPVSVPFLDPPRDSAGQSVPSQTLPRGPVASEVAIKQLGTNGGGFFSANSAHPFENPTPLSDFLEMLSVLLIPAALCFTLGRMVGDRRQGRALLAGRLPQLPLGTVPPGGEPAQRRWDGDVAASRLRGPQQRFQRARTF